MSWWSYLFGGGKAAVKKDQKKASTAVQSIVAESRNRSLVVVQSSFDLIEETSRQYDRTVKTRAGIDDLLSRMDQRKKRDAS